LTMGNIWTKNTRPESPQEAMLVDEPDFPALDSADQLPMHSDNKSTLQSNLSDGSQWNCDGHREKQCMTCGDWIDLGKVDTGDIALVNHEGKKRCLARLRSNQETQEYNAAVAALDDLRKSGTVSPHTPRHSRQINPPYTPLSPLSFVSGSVSSMSIFTLLHRKCSY
jgi:hypothetical protein